MFVYIALFATLLIRIQCSEYSKNNLRIPSVAELPTEGSVTNIGNSQSNTASGQNNGLTNIANVSQTNEEKGITRPCPIYDIYCIRHYFENHSHCKKAYGPVPDPVYRSQDTTYLPGINLTLTSVDVLYGGVNGRIEEFYINKETDKLVLAIQFKNVTYFSRNAYYRIHRRAKEPIVNEDFIYFNFESVTTTTVFPTLKNLALENSETHAYIDDSRPTYSIGGNLFNSPDPADMTVSNTQAALIATLPTSVQEYFLTDGPFFAATYIQHSICDFGLKLL